MTNAFKMSERVASLKKPDGSLSFEPELADKLIKWLDLCERTEDTLKGHIAELTAMLAPLLHGEDERLPRE